MATKTASGTDRNAQEQEGDATLLDTQSAAVKRLIAKGRERGHITFDELNAVLPQDQMSSEQIEDVMAALSEMGIQVLENEEQDEAGKLRKKPRKKLRNQTSLRAAILMPRLPAARMIRFGCICVRWGL